MKPLWAILGAVVVSAVGSVDASTSPGGLFRQRLGEAQRRFGQHAPASVTQPQRNPAPRRGPNSAAIPARVRRGSLTGKKFTRTVRRPPRSTQPHLARGESGKRITRKPASTRKPLRLSQYKPSLHPPAGRQPNVALTPRPAPKPVVTFSLAPRTPDPILSEETGDVFFSTSPRGVKVYFQFEGGETSSRWGLLVKELDPHPLHVRAFAPSLGLQVEANLPIKAGQMTRAHFFFPDRFSETPAYEPHREDAPRKRRTAE